jgi:type I restriction enzyme S subunit
MGIVNAIDITPQQRKIIKSLLMRHIPGVSVWAYGSRVKWTSRPDSDLDLIAFSAPEQRGKISALKEAFEESSLPFRVDLLVWDEVPEDFRQNILGSYLVLVEKATDKPGKMAEIKDWSVQPLEDCMSAIIDYRGKTPNKTTSGVPLVTAKVVKGGRIQKPDEFIAVKDFDAWMRRGMPQPGDVVMTTEAPLGEIAQLGAERVALAQRLITLRGKPDILNNTFLKFLMLSSDIQEQLVSRATGTTVLGIKQSELRKISLTLPPHHEQLAIAEILGTLDEKIELNRRTNETLEAMARDIFKDWFVDFGPTRAKMEGLEPYLAADLWSLFPDRLDDEGKPEGWEITPIAELIEIIGGGTPKTSVAEFWNGDIPWFSVVDAPSPSDVFVIGTEKHITESGLNSSSTRLLPVGATIITARGTVGKLACVGVPMTMNQSCYAIAGKPPYGPYFTYFGLKGAIQDLQANTHGSVFDTITRATFNAVGSVRPNDKVAQAFDDTVNPLMAGILSNLRENQALAQTRDLLLPKLLSGEVRVREAEKLLKESGV